MNQYRLFLYMALGLVVFALWNAWQKDYVLPSAASHQNEQATSAATIPPIASTTDQTQTTSIQPNSPALQAKPLSNLIQVKTDVLDAIIDTHGGNIVQISLPKYPKSVKEKNIPVVLLNNNPATLYVAQSGLLGKDGPDTEQGQAVYSVKQVNYSLQPDADTLTVNLHWQNNKGFQVTKSFVFKRGDYSFHVNYDVMNNSKQSWSGRIYSQLQRKPEHTSTSIFGFHTYEGAAISSANKPYEKITYSNMEKENLDRTIQGGWLAIQQHYFLSTWIPNQHQTNHYYSTYSNNGIYTIGFVGPVLTVPAGKDIVTGTTFYAGPELADKLKLLAPHLDLSIDYGWLWPISLAIFWIMKHIYKIVGNWGWSIVLITLLIKLVFYKLSETSYRSMAKMRNLAPRMQALKERYGDDRQKLSQATMELYKKEKVNPVGGCLPILIQIPFFIALYYVLIESVELRQAPFIFWIKDLSIHDPYYVLPILMGLSMFIQQKLNPPPPDPTQAKVMMFLPVVFTALFLAFPAGLVLYWLVNNCLSVLQQWYIMRRYERMELAKKK